MEKVADRKSKPLPGPRVAPLFNHNVRATGYPGNRSAGSMGIRMATLVITGSRDASGKEFLSLLPALPQRSGVSTAMVIDGDHSFSDPAQAKELISHIINYLNEKFHA
jgi:hypothetical protein